ncbi:hypothetical protein WME75_36425 [Sorangium sp. So ce1014]|uniref:hypothetical protein n=1 Tax=Sorangium sp. So ce1014 TaxID=3133326 RepID=UPI003F5F7157
MLEEVCGFRHDDLLLAMVRVELNLRAGKAERAEDIARKHRRRIAGQSFREEHVTFLLLLAECALALGNADNALRMVAGAELFISRAGWRHAACRVHRLRARAEALRGEALAARRGASSRLRDRSPSSTASSRCSLTRWCSRASSPSRRTRTRRCGARARRAGSPRTTP